MSASNFSGYSHPVYGAGHNQRRIVSGVTNYSNFTQMPGPGDSDSLIRARANQINTL